jgi:hypothetical protein
MIELDDDKAAIATQYQACMLTHKRWNDEACRLAIQAKSPNPPDSQITYGVSGTERAGPGCVKKLKLVGSGLDAGKFWIVQFRSIWSWDGAGVPAKPSITPPG